MADIAKVKRNIAKMIEQDAPEQDIDAYLASEGVSLDQLRGNSVTQPSTQQPAASVPAPSSFEQFKQRAAAGIPMPGTDFSQLDDKVRAVARGVPIIGGAMDELSAGLNTGFGTWGDYGKALDAERSKDKAYDEANPKMSTTLQVGGGILGTVAGVRGGKDYLPGASIPMPQSLPGKVGAGAGSGGLLGAIEAFTRGEGGFDNRWEAAKKAAGPSALIGGSMPLLGATVGKVYDYFKKPAASGLTSQGLKDAAAPLFEEARNANITLKPEAYNEILTRLRAGLGTDFVPENMPQLENAIAALEKRGGQPISFDELMNLRQVLKSAYSTGNPNQNRLMGQAIDNFDSMVEGLNPNAFSGDGDPQAIANIWGKARDYWSRGKNGELLDTIVENAKNAVGANYTEAGFQTAVKQQLRAIAKDNFKNYAWLKKPERDAILSVIRAEGMENFLNKLGKYSPLTLGGAARVGGLTYAANTVLPGSGPMVASVLGTAGLAARPLGSQITKRNMSLLGETLLQGKEVLPQQTMDELARLGLIYGAPIAGKSGAPVAGLLGGGGAW